MIDRQGTKVPDGLERELVRLFGSSIAQELFAQEPGTSVALIGTVLAEVREADVVSVQGEFMRRLRERTGHAKYTGPAFRKEGRGSSQTEIDRVSTAGERVDGWP